MEKSREREREQGESAARDQPPDPLEMRSRFGWQDREEMVLYDDKGSRLTEEQRREYLEAKSKKGKTVKQNPYKDT